MDIQPKNPLQSEALSHCEVLIDFLEKLGLAHYPNPIFQELKNKLQKSKEKLLNEKMVIALLGETCSGKTTVANILLELFSNDDKKPLNPPKIFDVLPFEEFSNTTYKWIITSSNDGYKYQIDEKELMSCKDRKDLKIKLNQVNIQQKETKEKNKKKKHKITVHVPHLKSNIDIIDLPGLTSEETCYAEVFDQIKDELLHIIYVSDLTMKEKIHEKVHKIIKTIPKTQRFSIIFTKKDEFFDFKNLRSNDIPEDAEQEEQKEEDDYDFNKQKEKNRRRILYKFQEIIEFYDSIFEKNEILITDVHFLNGKILTILSEFPQNNEQIIAEAIKKDIIGLEEFFFFKMKPFYFSKELVKIMQEANDALSSETILKDMSIHKMKGIGIDLKIKYINQLETVLNAYKKEFFVKIVTDLISNHTHTEIYFNKGRFIKIIVDGSIKMFRQDVESKVNHLMNTFTDEFLEKLREMFLVNGSTKNIDFNLERKELAPKYDEYMEQKIITSLILVFIAPSIQQSEMTEGFKKLYDMFISPVSKIGFWKYCKVENEVSQLLWDSYNKTFKSEIIKIFDSNFDKIISAIVEKLKTKKVMLPMFEIYQTNLNGFMNKCEDNLERKKHSLISLIKKSQDEIKEYIGNSLDNYLK